MIAKVVFLLWSLYASVSGNCLSPVSCECGKSNQSIVLCAEKTPLEANPCDLLSNCLTCRDEFSECLSCPFGFKGPTCAKKYGRKLTRRKRQTQIGSCPPLYPPVNGRITMCRNATRNGYCRASCNPGFTFQEYPSEPDITLECRRRGNWYPHNEFPTCVGGVVQSDCPDPGIPVGATRYPPIRPYPGLFDEDEQISFGCIDQDAELRGESLLTCRLDGSWSSPVPQCVVDQRNKECPFPGEIPNGEVTVRGRQGSSTPEEDDVFPSGTRLIYTCNEGYTRDGSSTLSCRRNGEWSDFPPYCISDDAPEPTNYCPNLGPVHHGRVTLEMFSRAPDPDNELPSGTTVRYECRRGYILQGSPNITCQDDGRWTGVLPACVEGCGLRSAEAEGFVTNGVTTKKGEWPWMVSISEVSASNVSNIICGGALLNRRTVLTAAHCLNHSGPYLLHFGKFYRSTTLDDEKVQSRWSQRIRKHPDFNPVTLENDVALIRFSPSIRYDGRILPVCLPTPESTRDNLTPQTEGIVTGWGRNELDTDPTSLMRARLPVQPNEICAESYRGLTFDPRTMLCAGYPEGRTSTCRGDSGSGLVFQDKHSQGRFVVEGLVSFNHKGSCGKPGRYTAFTRVSRFMNWIKSNI